MNILEIIRKKRDGHPLTEEEIRFVIDGYTGGDIPDYQMSAFLMAVFFRGMDPAETQSLTVAMLHSGEVLDFSSIPGCKVDKHSTGGVGDKTSLILAPVAAAAGVKVPMISGRGLGHTGGTLDKLEAIPGFNVNLTEAEFRRGVEEIGLCLIGQTAAIAPADKKIYALRDVTGTVESIPLITASIMSKKLAEGIDALVLDVKTGSGAFMKNIGDARDLARALMATGRRMGKQVTALITNMEQPLGLAAGNAVEVEESIQTLRGEGPPDLTGLSVELAAAMVLLAGLAGNPAEAREICWQQIRSGRALEKFAECIRYHGGDARVIDSPSFLPQATGRQVLAASASGWLAAADAEAAGMAVVLLGGGRLRKEDRVDPAAGLWLHKKVGDPVQAGEPLATLLYNDAQKRDQALQRLEGAFRISDQPVAPLPLILERLE